MLHDQLQRTRHGTHGGATPAITHTYTAGCRRLGRAGRATTLRLFVTKAWPPQVLRNSMVLLGCYLIKEILWLGDWGVERIGVTYEAG